MKQNEAVNHKAGPKSGKGEKTMTINLNEGTYNFNGILTTENAAFHFEKLTKIVTPRGVQIRVYCTLMRNYITGETFTNKGEARFRETEIKHIELFTA